MSPEGWKNGRETTIISGFRATHHVCPEPSLLISRSKAHARSWCRDCRFLPAAFFKFLPARGDISRLDAAPTPRPQKGLRDLLVEGKPSWPCRYRSPFPIRSGTISLRSRVARIPPTQGSAGTAPARHATSASTIRTQRGMSTPAPPHRVTFSSSDSADPSLSDREILASSAWTWA